MSDDVEIAEANAEAAVAIAEVQAEAAVEIAQTDAERTAAVVDSIAELRGLRDELGSLRAAFDAHVTANGTDFTAVGERIALLETGVAVMNEALNAEADALEEEIREEIREEIAHETPSEADVVVVDEGGPASVEHAEAAEPPSIADELTERREKKRHFISL
jgi:hypothetical protein